MSRLTQLIELLFDAYGVNNEMTKKAYTLMLSKVDVKWLEKRIPEVIATWKPEYGRVIPSIAEIIHVEKRDDSEQAWSQALESAKRSGSLPVTPRTAKALNSLGGMIWLRNSNPDNVQWDKKAFIEAYKNTPEDTYVERCPGLEAPILEKGDEQCLMLEKAK